MQLLFMAQLIAIVCKPLTHVDLVLPILTWMLPSLVTYKFICFLQNLIFVLGIPTPPRNIRYTAISPKSDGVFVTANITWDVPSYTTLFDTYYSLKFIVTVPQFTFDDTTYDNHYFL